MKKKIRVYSVIVIGVVIGLLLYFGTSSREELPFDSPVHVTYPPYHNSFDEKTGEYSINEPEERQEIVEESSPEKGNVSEESIPEKEIEPVNNQLHYIPVLDIVADYEEEPASPLFQVPGNPVLYNIFNNSVSVCALLKSEPKENAPHKYKAFVSRVIDGDTIIIARRGKADEKVRLAGIDAPESKQKYGKEAKEYLTNLIFNQSVTIESKGTDQYNRVIGIVYLGKSNINKNLVENGFVWFWKDYSYGLDYQPEQNKAYEEKKGLWQDSNAIPPWLYRKLESTGTFGKTVMAGGFYLDSRGVLHNSRCNQYPKYRWDGISKHPNCQICGGAIFD